MYVTCTFLGGLGNQLFQAAVTLSTAWDQKLQAVFIDKPPECNAQYPRPNYWSSVFRSLTRVSEESTKTYAVYAEGSDHRVIPIPKFSQSTRLFGYFQSSNYFNKHKQLLRQTFTLDEKDKSRVDTIISILNPQQESLVSLHVRRTDYCLLNWELSLTYYTQALSRVPSNSIILVFTDDLSWCKTKLAPLLLPYKAVHYISHFVLPDYLELFLMARCQTMILANSSFSWWGAYLGEAKIIYAPAPPWIGTEPCPGIYESSWTIISREVIETKLKLSINQPYGGLGNKLFQAAAMVALAAKVKNTQGLEVSLHMYLGPYANLFTTFTEVDKTCDSLVKWTQPSFKYTPIPEELKSPGLVLEGYYQSPKYFQGYEQLIRQTFGHSHDNKDVIDYYQKLRGVANHIVAIHIRRGDYVQQQDKHPVLPLMYYYRSIKEITKIVKSQNIKYLIFSDDPSWCKTVYWPVPVEIVNAQAKGSGLLPEVFDLYLMSKCDSFIIANSSYSWWGAYLSGSKVVIYPSLWFGPTNGHLDTVDLCPTSWTKISTSNPDNTELFETQKLGQYEYLYHLCLMCLPEGLKAKGRAASSPEVYYQFMMACWKINKISQGLEAAWLLLEHYVDYTRENYSRLYQDILYHSTSEAARFRLALWSKLFGKSPDTLMPGRVSVIIPTYNRFSSVQKSIQSVLNQDYKYLEVIVINDCSTDAQYQTLDNIYKDEFRVTIVNLPVNLRIVHNTKAAQGATRMAGVARATGQYLAFLDDDDIWTDQSKLTKQIGLLMTHPEYKLCTTNMDIAHNGKPTGLYYTETIGTDLKDPANPSVRIFTTETIRHTNYINNSTVVVDRIEFDLAGGQKPEVYEDYRCWQRILQGCAGALYIPESTVLYDMDHGQGKEYVYVID